MLSALLSLVSRGSGKDDVGLDSQARLGWVRKGDKLATLKRGIKGTRDLQVSEDSL